MGDVAYLLPLLMGAGAGAQNARHWRAGRGARRGGDPGPVGAVCHALGADRAQQSFAAALFAGLRPLDSMGLAPMEAPTGLRHHGGGDLPGLPRAMGLSQLGGLSSLHSAAV